MSRMQFLNIEVDNLTMEEALQRIDELIVRNKSKNSRSYIATPNVDNVVRAEKDEDLRKIYNTADLVLTDGKPLIWISRIYGMPIIEKVSGSDLFPGMCRLAAQKGYSMFFLGAAEGVADKAAYNLRKRYPGLRISGTYSPPLGFEKDETEMDRIINMIRSAETDILILALGCPKQECFFLSCGERVNVPLTIGLGATLDFEAGKIKRAPSWMSNHGLEWLFRITQDPKRLAKRYLIDDMKIFPIAFKYRPRRKKRSKRG